MTAASLIAGRRDRTFALGHLPPPAKTTVADVYPTWVRVRGEGLGKA